MRVCSDIVACMGRSILVHTHAMQEVGQGGETAQQVSAEAQLECGSAKMVRARCLRMRPLTSVDLEAYIDEALRERLERVMVKLCKH